MNEYLANVVEDVGHKTRWAAFAQEIRANIATWSKARLNAHIDLLLSGIANAEARGDRRSARELRIEATVCAHVWLRRAS